MKIFRMIHSAAEKVKVYFGKPLLTWDSMLNFTDVSPFITGHLRQVYFSLFFVLLSSFLGSVSHFYINIGGSTTVVGFIGCMVWFSSIQPWREKNRIYLLIAAAFGLGASMEYLISPFTTVNQALIITVLGETAVIFGCLTAAASRRRIQERDFTYSYGLLYTHVLVSIWLYTAPPLFCEEYIYTLYFFQPYVGSLGMFWYVLMYSQEMVEQTRRGNCYYSEHSVMLFTDIPAILLRFSSISVKRLYKVYQQKRRN